MSRFSGPQFKGAAKVRRQERHDEAVARNVNASAVRRMCGHVHGAAQALRCDR